VNPFADDSAAATLPARCRLKTRRHFRRVYGRGRRASGRWLTVIGVPGRSDVEVRVGLSVSKAHGGAVRRNKIKRLLREAFRLERHRFPRGLDLVLIPRQRDDNYPLAELRTELQSLVERLLQARPADRHRKRRGGGRS